MRIDIKSELSLSLNMSNTISDHKQLIASLSQEQRSALTKKSDFMGLCHLLSHLVAISLTGVWILNGWMGWQIVLGLHGVLLVFLFTLLHETVHFTVFKSPRLNTITGWFCALILFLPPNWFRYFHLAHHRHTHDPEKDPELEGRKTENLSNFVWTVTGLPIWFFHLKMLFMNAFASPGYAYVPCKGIPKIKSEARTMMAVYIILLFISLYFQSTILIWLWLLPILLGQPFLRLYLMAEHGRCPNVANMLENTRTTYTSQFVRWLAWNMPYHSEHHAYPAVPFHQLPKFHEVAKKHLKVTENGYIKFQKKQIKTILNSEGQS